MHASIRHYDFMLRGLAETASAIQSRNIFFDCRHGDPGSLIPAAAADAALLKLRPFTTAALKRKGDLGTWLESVEARMEAAADG